MMENLKNIVEILSFANRIEGRKKFQKIVYILQQLGADLDEKFVYHHYGPYSVDLQLEIDLLVNKGVILEERNESSYSYELRKDYTDKNSNLYNFENTVEELNGEPATFLEVLSTIFYLHEMGYEEDELIFRKLKSLKPQLNHHFEEALARFKELRNN